MCLTDGFEKNDALKTDFRVWLKVDKILKSDIGAEDKIIAVLGLAYISLPQNLEKALKVVTEFYTCGNAVKGNTSCARSFDFEYDGELILAAFRQQYGINLLKEDMHWHEFLALLRCLNADTLFMRTVNVRNADLSEIKDKDRRREIAKLKRACALPHTKKEEKENEELIKRLKNRG